MIICLTLPPLSSLNNQSDKVRWSLDLRWQRVDKPVGFFGLKEGVQMRSSTDPNFKINWEGFNALDRHEEAAKHLDRVTNYVIRLFGQISFIKFSISSASESTIC